ncbi:MAG: hypothetical protein ACP5GG_04085, partial [Conexivisphaera sp.]
VHRYRYPPVLGSFDDLYPMRRPRHPFERVLSWLSGFKFLRNHCSRTPTWGGRRWSGIRLRGWRGSD